MLIDLHAHTTFSDGSFSPEGLIEEAVKNNVRVLAITDHDEIGAIPLGLKYSQGMDFKLVPGVELSIDYELKGQGHLHLLGLFIDHNNKTLKKSLKILKEARQSRILQMADKMNRLGHNISEEDIKQKVRQGSAGRPHIAQILIEKGIVNSLYEAFKKYLSKGRPAYVPKVKLKIEPAIDLIHSAGGIAILAHPYSLGFSNYPRLGQEILKLKDYGLDGIEVYYTNHDQYLTKWLKEFAESNELLISGGSDFHGSAKPNTKLGKGTGVLNIPYEVFENLKNFINEN